MRMALAIAAVAAAVVAATSGAATPTTSGRPQRTINIAVFLASSANTYWAAELLLGAKDIGQEESGTSSSPCSTGSSTPTSR